MQKKRGKGVQGKESYCKPSLEVWERLITPAGPGGKPGMIYESSVHTRLRETGTSSREASRWSFRHDDVPEVAKQGAL